MTTKEYLGQVRDMKRRVFEKQAEINAMRQALTSISVNTEDERVKASSDPDKIGAMISTILEREAELKTFVEKFVRKERLISSQIDSIYNPRCRELLHWRYIEEKTFEDISVNYMHITFRHAMRLHGRALNDFESQYGNLYKK